MPMYILQGGRHWFAGLKAVLIILLLVISGCDTSENIILSDKDLRQRHHQCRMTSVLSTEKAVECKLIRRQCSERLAQGKEVCADSL